MWISECWWRTSDGRAAPIKSDPLLKIGLRLPKKYRVVTMSQAKLRPSELPSKESDGTVCSVADRFHHSKVYKGVRTA